MDRGLQTNGGIKVAIVTEEQMDISYGTRCGQAQSTRVPPDGNYL